MFQQEQELIKFLRDEGELTLNHYLKKVNTQVKSEDLKGIE